MQVFCDRPDHVNPALLPGGGRVRLVATPEEADVLYLIDHTIDAADTATTTTASASAAPAPAAGGGDVHAGEHPKHGKVSSQFCWNGMVVTKESLLRTLCHGHAVLQRRRRATTSSSSSGGSSSGISGSDGVGRSPLFPPTYDLAHPAQLAAFVAAARRRPNDPWILKRYRGRQSVDYPLTNHLPCALRHLDSAPRLAARYVAAPGLHHGRKFDLRYYVCVRSLQPLVLRRHRLFTVRAANEAFSCADWEHYQKHFTVMNFMDDSTAAADDAVRAIRGEGAREHVTVDAFVAAFDADHVGQTSWAAVQARVDRVLARVFEAVQAAWPDEPGAAGGHPNGGWSLTQPHACPARAMFGVDVILSRRDGAGEEDRDEDEDEDEDGDDSTQQVYRPYVLEVQWAPDCTPAVRFRPGFWEEVLACLYLDDDGDQFVPLPTAM